MIKILKSQYSGAYKEIARYWVGYGGITALISSPFFHLAIVITAVSFPAWYNQEWWMLVLEIIPNLLGFTLGGYAIWLAGDNKFREMLSGSLDNKISPYLSINYAFLHFILIQILALVFSLIVKGVTGWSSDWNNWTVLISGALGYLLFIYAILSALATVIAIVRYSRWYDTHIANLKENSK